MLARFLVFGIPPGRKFYQTYVVCIDVMPWDQNNNIVEWFLALRNAHTQTNTLLLH
jgi:hypothetical protein